jgi:hypothetical protein
MAGAVAEAGAAEKAAKRLKNYRARDKRQGVCAEVT